MKPLNFLLNLLFWSVGLNAQLSSCEIETINKDFELPVIPQTGNPSFFDALQVPGWGTTAIDNVIEMWPNANSNGGVPAYSGSQYIELNTNLNPKILCDEDFNETITVDLSEWNSELINNVVGIQFSYYESELEAINGTNTILNFSNNPITANLTTIWIVLTNDLGCREIRFVQDQIGNKVPVNDTIFELESICLLFESTVNLTEAESQFSSESNVQYYYYTSLVSA